jgi:hypothetical protein
MTVALLALREWREFIRRPQALLLKLAYPIVVGLPLLTSAAPPFYAAMALTLLASTLSALGTASVFARERQSAMQQRLRLLPLPAWRANTARLCACASIDLVQLVPIILVVMLLHPAAQPWWPALALTLGGTVLLCNALGAVASTFSSSAGEVMLWALLPLFPAFYLSGLFAPASGAARWVELVMPWHHLHETLIASLGGATAEDVQGAALAGGLTIAVALLFSAFSGRRVLETR